MSQYGFGCLPALVVFHKQFVYDFFLQFGTPDPRSSAERAVPGDGALKRVADKVKSRDWDRLANKLNFDSEEINKFKSQHRDPEDQVNYYL